METAQMFYIRGLREEAEEKRMIEMNNTEIHGIMKCTESCWIIGNRGKGKGE
jgi:hypothetical protein